HHKNFAGIAASGEDDFETPLGKVRVNKDLLASLMKYDKEIFVDNDAHEIEHSIEVQLPFLQTVMKDFKIIPLLFGGMSVDTCVRLAQALQAVSDDKTLIITSTDLSHYHDYETAKTMDSRAITAILEANAQAFLTSISEAKAEACAFPAVTSMLVAAPYLGINRIQLLNSSNSGDVTPEKNRVVGYASIAFIRKQIVLSDSDKKKLLSFSRSTLNSIFSGGKTGISMNGDALLTPGGVFATLKKHGQLRGCIGYLYPVKPLYKAVADNTVLAATKDNRFPPVTSDEVKDIEIEISVLSPFRRVSNTDDIVVGRDGLFIEKSGKSGLLLPQVPGEFGWGRAQFLENLCLKAGLGNDDWKSPNARIYSFTAEVFGE
ncbi:MAG: AmmeMemoRadiSam system protein B, partial [Patescibacteria group bacterium]